MKQDIGGIHIYIIDRELTPSEKIHLCKTGIKPDFIFTDQAYSHQYKFAKPLPLLDPCDQAEINSEVLNQVLSFGDIKIRRRSVSEMYRFDNSSIWYYHKFRIFITIRNIAYKLARIKSLLQDGTMCTIYSSEPIMDLAFSQDNNITVKLKPDRTKIKFNTKVLFGFRTIYRFFIAIIQRIRIRKHGIWKIENAAQYQRMLDLNGTDYVCDNPYWGYLWQIQTVKTVVIDLIQWPQISSIPNKPGTRRKKRINEKRLFEEWILVRAILSFRIRKSVQATMNNFASAEKKMEMHQFKSWQEYIPVLLKRYQKSTKFYLLKYFAFKSFFDRVKPRMVWFMDENNPNHRTIWENGKSLDFKTIAYQHGTVHKHNLNNLFTEQDQKLALFPDVHLVWGQYWKKLLEGIGNVPPNHVRVIGNIRSEVIPHLKKMDSRKRILIPQAGSNRIILYATQPFRDTSWTIQVASGIFNAIKLERDCHVLIKMHPSENNEELYKSLAEDAGLDNYCFSSPDIDLYEYLFYSDLLITSFSSVIYEAALFKIPIVSYDPYQEDPLDLKNDTLVHYATTEHELFEQLITAFKSKMISNPLSREYIKPLDTELAIQLLTQ